MKKIMVVVVLMLIASPAFADYGYQRNKYGTGYFRDNSNDGNQYNNANTIGLNGPSVLAPQNPRVRGPFDND